jgi:type II secretory pathway predicted ATPase ExeA
MYERFYGLRTKPFSITPQAAFMYPSRRHSVALELLQYGIASHAPFVVVTGEIGTGKTTLLRYLVGRIPTDMIVASVEHAYGDYGELLPWIAGAFGLPASSTEVFALEKSVLEHVTRSTRFGRGVLLVIDEAQGLTHEALERLRVLSNVNGSGQNGFQVLLAGQPGLRERLRDPALKQLAQRVAVDYHLEPLELDETARYIRHRLRVAGSENDALFDDGACEAVHASTAGVPRLVNLMCDFALLYGCSNRLSAIGRDVVEEVARDRAGAISTA